MSVARALLVAGVLALSGCSEALRWDPPADQPGAGRSAPAARPSGNVHVVRPGETLFAIAFRYGLDHRELARINNLGDGSLIYPGQEIRLGGAAGPVRPLSGGWQWPTAGAVVSRYGQSPQTQSGIQIGGLKGQPVVAAADGEVVYSGRGLIGYGALLIIKHDATWLSAYGHNDSLLVAEGARVRAGQRIATMGEGPGRRPLLHFEIRRNGDPIDPMTQLPSR